MKINPQKLQTLTPPLTAKTEKTRGLKTESAEQADAQTAAAAMSGDNFQTGKKQKIMQALQNEPDVRPDVLARAKALAADDSYPSDDVLDHVAKLFVQDAAKSK